MGAQQFEVRAKGKTAAEAFENAVAEAFYEYGHRGYTGSIAEKAGRGYTLFTVPEGMTPEEFVAQVQRFDPQGHSLLGNIIPLIKHASEATDDKWGPAGCVKAKDDEWIFFGWASS